MTATAVQWNDGDLFRAEALAAGIREGVRKLAEADQAVLDAKAEYEAAGARWAAARVAYRKVSEDVAMKLAPGPVLVRLSSTHVAIAERAATGLGVKFQRVAMPTVGRA